MWGVFGVGVGWVFVVFVGFVGGVVGVTGVWFDGVVGWWVVFLFVAPVVGMWLGRFGLVVFWLLG